MKSDEGLSLFPGGEPDQRQVWELYEKGRQFNSAIKLEETVRVNENFYIGKQWEGVEANGLPTPQFNFLKRVVGFIVATITTDNVRVTATAMENGPEAQGDVDMAEIVNREFESLAERNDIPSLLRQFARNTAVDGDGCLYSYWEADEEGREEIRTEIIENTRVFFGNPNDRQVQSQPWIIISSRELSRKARRRARDEGFENWQDIRPDEDERELDSSKRTDDKSTVLLLLWRDEDTGRIRAYECTRNCPIRKSWDTGLGLYPLCWLNWDYVQDCYHGQAMLTGLIPNQIFVNKIWAASMLSFLKTAYPKVIYDRTRLRAWDNRVGAAIGVNGGDVNTVARIMEPASISPQISQFIRMAVEQTEQSLGASSVALGDTKPDNTSAIIALQRAASTPTELTKQNLYRCVEDLFRIYLEFMGEYYGKRRPRPESQEISGPEQREMGEFDFSRLKKHPMILKLDVGASSYYSEIASIQTLDNLLKSGHITPLQYLERIPDGYIPARRALIAELKEAAAPEKEPEPGAMPGGLPEELAKAPQLPPLPETPAIMPGPLPEQLPGQMMM